MYVTLGLYVSDRVEFYMSDRVDLYVHVTADLAPTRDGGRDEDHGLDIGVERRDRAGVSHPAHALHASQPAALPRRLPETRRPRPRPALDRPPGQWSVVRDQLWIALQVSGQWSATSSGSPSRSVVRDQLWIALQVSGPRPALDRPPGQWSATGSGSPSRSVVRDRLWIALQVSGLWSETGSGSPSRSVVRDRLCIALQVSGPRPALDRPPGQWSVRPRPALDRPPGQWSATGSGSPSRSVVRDRVWIALQVSGP